MQLPRLFFTCLCFSYAFAVQNCYDCDPTSDGMCVDPQLHNIKSTNCEASTETQYAQTSIPLDYACFTIVTKNGDNPGIYRGCVDGFTGDGCEHLKNKTRSSEYDKCKICSGEKCNSENPIDNDNNDNNDANNVTHLLPLAKSCYKCDPSSKGGCLDPQNSTAETVNCEASDTYQQTSAPLDYECFTFRSTEKNPGIFRGCLSGFSGDPCEEVKKQYGALMVENCKTCRGDKCNNEQIIRNNNKGFAKVTNSVSILAAVVVLAVLTL